MKRSYEITKDMILLRQKGFTYAEIGEKYGVSKQCVHQRIKNFTDISGKIMKKSYKVEVTKDMVLLRQKGFTYVEIGKKYGVSKQCVYRRINDFINFTRGKKMRGISIHDTCIYPNLIRFMLEQDIGMGRLADILGLNKRRGYLRARMVGETDFLISEIQNLLEYSGKEFEWLFARKEDAGHPNEARSIIHQNKKKSSMRQTDETNEEKMRAGFVLDACIYPNLIRFMNERGIGMVTLADILGMHESKRISLRGKLTGDVDFLISEIQNLLEYSGKKFEWLFARKERAENSREDEDV